MTGVDRELEKLGHATTGPDPSDRRALRVTLTARGVEYGEAATAVSEGITAASADRLGAAPVKALQDQLRALAEGPPG